MRYMSTWDDEVCFPEESREPAVYAIRNELTGFVKIGVSGNPEGRRSALEFGCGMPLTLLCHVRHVDAFGIERILHARHAERRLIGEWFSPHADLDADIALLRDNVTALYEEAA